MAKTSKQSLRPDGSKKIEKAAEMKQIKHILKGRVVAATLPQTVTVLVERKKMHPMYGKSYVSSKRYQVHTDKTLALGDVVEIAQIRPMSKCKFFAVTSVVGRDIEAVVSEQLKEEAEQQIAEVMPEESEDGKQKTEKTEEAESGNPSSVSPSSDKPKRARKAKKETK